MPNPRVNALLVLLVSAILIPRIQAWTGLKLTNADVAALMPILLGVFHTVIEPLIQRYLLPALSSPLSKDSPHA